MGRRSEESEQEEVGRREETVMRIMQEVNGKWARKWQGAPLDLTGLHLVKTMDDKKEPG